MQVNEHTLARGAGFPLLVLLCTTTAQAQGPLKTIQTSEGGKIVYGQVAGQTTEAGAMGAVLRSIHNQYGDRPQVGRLFQVRGTQSVAAFFNVKKRNQGSGRWAGLIIAAKATTDHVEAAVVSDDASRFATTLSPMMKTLFGVWHPLDAARTAGSGSNSAAGPLRQTVLPDRSASVGLPDGWRIVPNMSMMGTIVALGPNGESAELGVTFLANDTNNPNVQRTLQTLRMGGLRNTSYAQATYYPYGANMAKTYVDLMQNVRHKANLPPASYKFTSVTPMPGAQRCARMAGTADLQDGKGPRELNVVYCTSPPGRAGGWLSVAYSTMVPVQFAAQQRATLGAILASYREDPNVVGAQAAAIARPVIDQIHAVGRAAADQAAAAHQRNEIQNSSVYQHWDSIDRRSKEFSNYQLGYSVVHDIPNNAHGTLWNEDADWLVQHDPQRYEYVSAPNFWKGIDY